MRDIVRPWAPAMFCAFLCLIALVGDIVLRFVTGPSGPASSISIAFYCFLPMCFYFVGESLVKLQHENRELRARLEEVVKDGI